MKHAHQSRSGFQPLSKSDRNLPPQKRQDAASTLRATRHPLALLALLLFFTLHPSLFTLPVFAATQSPQIRVVSQTVGNDELLLAVAAPAQIACLSHLSTTPDFTAVADEAAAYPQLTKNATAETILSYSPTLVLFTDYSRTELVEQIRRAGIRTITISKYHTLDDAYENLRLIARELGPDAEARAEKIITDGRARVAALREKLRDAKPVRVIAPSTYGLIPGDQSTFQDLCDHAAAENLAATLGGLHGHQPPPSEKMLAWPVDKVVLTTGSHKSDPSAPSAKTHAHAVRLALAPFVKLPPYQFMPAIREARVALLETWQLSCVSHHRIHAYERLARELHPARFALMQNEE